MKSVSRKRFEELVDSFSEDSFDPWFAKRRLALAILGGPTPALRKELLAFLKLRRVRAHLRKKAGSKTKYTTVHAHLQKRK